MSSILSLFVFILGDEHNEKSRFNEEQIIGILKKQQSDMTAVELCRRYGIGGATFYKWRSKYGNMEVPDTMRLKSLEAKNAHLKKLQAEKR